MASILQKKRLNLRNLEISLRPNEQTPHPKVFTKINVKFSAEGEGITENTSPMQYASVWRNTVRRGMLSKTAEISWTVEIL